MPRELRRVLPSLSESTTRTLARHAFLLFTEDPSFTRTARPVPALIRKAPLPVAPRADSGFNRRVPRQGPVSSVFGQASLTVAIRADFCRAFPTFIFGAVSYTHLPLPT